MSTLPPPQPVQPAPWILIPDQRKTGMSTAALVLGIVAMCIGLIPILGIFALPCALLAIIFGIVGIIRKLKRGFAIAGLITGVLGIMLSIAGIVIVNNAFNHVDKCFDAVSNDLHNDTNTADTVCGN